MAWPTGVRKNDVDQNRDDDDDVCLLGRTTICDEKLALWAKAGQNYRHELSSAASSHLVSCFYNISVQISPYYAIMSNQFIFEVVFNLYLNFI